MPFSARCRAGRRMRSNVRWLSRAGRQIAGKLNCRPGPQLRRMVGVTGCMRAACRHGARLAAEMKLALLDQTQSVKSSRASSLRNGRAARDARLWQSRQRVAARSRDAACLHRLKCYRILAARFLYRSIAINSDKRGRFRCGRDCQRADRSLTLASR